MTLFMLNAHVWQDPRSPRRGGYIILYTAAARSGEKGCNKSIIGSSEERCVDAQRFQCPVF